MKGRCQQCQRGTLNRMSAFLFFSPKYFFDISISGGRTGERMVSEVPKRYPYQDACIFVFRPKNFFFNY